jgi:WD and tetratricopeptide repeat-containing protein 1
MNRPLTATYLAFSPDGSDLIVNLGSEQIYIYDKFALFGQQPATWEQLAVMENKTCDKAAAVRNGRVSTSLPPLPPRVEQIKLEANVEFQNGNYFAAIRLYNQALVRCPHPTLYGNRAAALMKRAWSGDVYAALRDCVAALTADPGHVKAHLRLVRCLLDLGRCREAGRWLSLFAVRFPEQARCQAYLKLDKELKAANEKEAEELATKGNNGTGTTSSSESSSSSNSNSSNHGAQSRFPGFGVDFRRTDTEEVGQDEEAEISPRTPHLERGRRISAQVAFFFLYMFLLRFVAGILPLSRQRAKSVICS